MFVTYFDEQNGGLTYLGHREDCEQMNYLEGTATAGTLCCLYTFDPSMEKERIYPHPLGHAAVAKCLSATPTERGMHAVYRTPKLRVEVERTNAGAAYTERYTFFNDTGADVFTHRGELGIFMPFADSYEGAEECFCRRVHAHLFMGGSGAYACALRMGESPYHLGMVVTEGAMDAYSVYRDESRGSNDRGDFLLHIAPFHLEAGASYTLTLSFFFHGGRADFEAKRRGLPGILCAEAESYLVFAPEKFHLHCSSPATVSLDGEVLGRDVTALCYAPRRCGEHCFVFAYGEGQSTSVRTYALPSFSQLLEERMTFLLTRQQYTGRGPLQGAFLIYDNEEEGVYFDNIFHDHNACRERVGMGLLLCAYLRTRKDPRALAALERYVTYVYREFYDRESGRVYNTVGKNPNQQRLYNAPWLSRLQMELYYVTGEHRYLSDMLQTLRVYYANGGDGFYPNGLSMEECVTALRDGGMEGEAAELMGLFGRHVDRMLAIGLHYPPHEVNFEQTIVTPAATFFSQYYRLSGEQRYLRAAEEQMAVLERFSGFAPDVHLNEIAIRHWDGFWFGKGRLYGDTFPHYWSILSSYAFLLHAQNGGGEAWYRRAMAGAKHCLCLFREGGRASCAYLYPYAVNGRRGEYYDAFANDQDFALYYYLKYFVNAEKTEM